MPDLDKARREGVTRAAEDKPCQTFGDIAIGNWDENNARREAYEETKAQIAVGKAIHGK